MELRNVRSSGPVALVAAVFVVTAELVRAVSPSLDHLAGQWGVVDAALLAVVIFGAPALLGPLVAVAGQVRATAVLLLALVVLRLTAQATPVLPVLAAGAAVGVAALVLVIGRAATSRSGMAATTGVLLGGIVDQAIRSAFQTWDPIFRSGALPWLVAAAVVTATVVAFRSEPDAPTLSGGRFGVAGVYLGLYVMVYGSAGFVASQAGVPLPAASAVLIVTGVVGLELVRRMTLPGATGAIPEPDRWFAGTLALAGLVAGIAVAYWWTGPIVLAAVGVAGLAAAVLMARALTPGPQRSARRVRLTLAGLAAGVGYVLPVMLFQTHYELEFPFDNRYVLVAAAVVLGLAGIGRRPWPADATRGRLLARPAWGSIVAAGTLLVPLAMVATRPAVPESTQTGTEVRLMSWNVRYGRSDTGTPDPETIAATIERVAPDVVVLQEVSRGWPIGGGVDVAEWLSRRLAMPYEWSPAADGQFGNVVLTRMPLVTVAAQRLPFVQGPMQRSYLDVTLRLDAGGELRVINAHLQHRKVNSETRLAQSEALVAAWDGDPHTVIAGDFNFWPSWPEPEVFRAAGFQSAQDVTGHGDQFTTATDRVDWIFGTPDLVFTDFEVMADVTVSDHHPLVVTVRPA